jgi:hypothetical protein
MFKKYVPWTLPGANFLLSTFSRSGSYYETRILFLPSDIFPDYTFVCISSLLYLLEALLLLSPGKVGRDYMFPILLLLASSCVLTFSGVIYSQISCILRRHKHFIVFTKLRDLNFLFPLNHLRSEVLENSESFIELLYVKSPYYFLAVEIPVRKLLIVLFLLLKFRNTFLSINFNEGEDKRDTFSKFECIFRNGISDTLHSLFTLYQNTNIPAYISVPFCFTCPPLSVSSRIRL